MYLRKNKVSSENTVCPFLTLDELDEGSFKKMRIHISIYNPAHPWLGMSNEEMLHSAGFWRRNPLTNQEGYILAVVLLFGKEQPYWIIVRGTVPMPFTGIWLTNGS